MSKTHSRESDRKRSASPSGRRYSEDFKRDAVRLVADEKYSFRAAAVGVSEKSLRDWHARMAPSPTPCGNDATIEPLQEEIKRLRKSLRRAEQVREILTKATAYFAKESQ